MSVDFPSSTLPQVRKRSSSFRWWRSRYVWMSSLSVAVGCMVNLSERRDAEAAEGRTQRKLSVMIDDPSDSVLEKNHIEIDQKTEREPGDLQVSLYLRHVQ